MRLRKLYVAVAALALLAAAGQARAQTYTVDYTHDVTAGLENPVVRTSSGQTLNRIPWAGARNASWHVGSPKPPNLPNSFSVYCVDLIHEAASPNRITVEPIGPGLPGADQRMLQAAYLYNAHLADVFAASGNDRLVKGAALQIAIWGTLDGSTTVSDPTNGHFFLSSVGNANAAILTPQVRTLADQWLAALDSKVGSALLLKTDRSIMGNQGQDMIGPPPSAVPEPSSLLLLVSASLACLGAVRFRNPFSRRC